MKKIITALLVLVLILSLVPAAFADVDLSGMSYDELVALRDQINLAIWNSQEWQEVTVPYGVWKIGEDIPAGKWTITVCDGGSLFLRVGVKLNAAGTEIDGSYDSWLLRSSTRRSFDPASDIESVTIDLHDGEYLTIDEGSVIFTPYAGKPSLGFK